MSPPPIHVRGLGLWAPGVGDVQAWRRGLHDPAFEAPVGGLMPRATNRRATGITRMVSDVLERACARASLSPSQVGLVLGTVGGELAVTFECLELTAQDPPTSSPLRFRNSVHNAALGHLGIALDNAGYASAMAVSRAQAALATWLEALGWLAAHGGHAAVILADETWPGHDFPPLATAVVLSTEPGDRPLGQLGAIGREPGDVPIPDLGALGANPSAWGLAVLGALATGTPGRVTLAEPPGESPWSIAWTPAAP